MTKLILRGIFLSLSVTTGLVLLAMLLGQIVPKLPGRDGTTLVLGLFLIGAAVIDWLPVFLCYRAYRRNPGIPLLEDQFERLFIESLTATILGGLSFNYIIGSPLPRQLGFILLVEAVLLVSVPPLHFLLKTYREA